MKATFFRPQNLLMLTLALASITAFAAGGVSGGGGHILTPVDPRDPASPSEARTLVIQSRFQAIQLLDDKFAAFKNGQLKPEERNTFEELFRQPKDVREISRQVGLHVESEEPCFDRDRLPVDGSLVSERQGTVCMSAFSISQKVERADLRAQSTALIVHEYSELAGFDEDKAVNLQTVVLQQLRQ